MICWNFGTLAECRDSPCSCYADFLYVIEVMEVIVAFARAARPKHRLARSAVDDGADESEELHHE